MQSKSGSQRQITTRGTECRVRVYLGDFPILMNFCDFDLGCCFVSSLDTMAIDNAQDLRPDVPSLASTVANVSPLRGRPTKEELLVHYPAKFTWSQLKTFINSGWVRTSFSSPEAEGQDSVTWGYSSEIRNSRRVTRRGRRVYTQNMGQRVRVAYFCLNTRKYSS